MTKKTKAEQARHQHDSVYCKWMSRPLGERRANDADLFVDQMWAQGPRMGETQEIHRQLVMNVIRADGK